MTIPLSQSYDLCRQQARQARSSFYWSFWLLPAEKRRAMHALYAFARHTDDLADRHPQSPQRKEQLDAWKADLSNALAGEFHHPLLPALSDTVQRYEIPQQYLFDLLDGVAMDLEPPRYETAEDLNRYCYRVASAIGLACIHIWGFEDEEFRRPAIACGQAFQWTNILRDLKEDARHQRFYLPRQDMATFDVDEEILASGGGDDRVRELVLFEVQRTERLYRESQATIRFLSSEGQRVFATMFATYRRLLETIKRADGDVFTRPIRLGWSQRVGIIASHAFGLAASDQHMAALGPR